MTQYIHRSKSVRAIQFVPENVTKAAILDLAPNANVVANANGEIRSVAIGPEVVGHLEWITRAEDGEVKIISELVFDRDFEEEVEIQQATIEEIPVEPPLPEDQIRVTVEIGSAKHGFTAPLADLEPEALAATVVHTVHQHFSGGITAGLLPTPPTTPPAESPVKPAPTPKTGKAAA